MAKTQVYLRAEELAALHELAEESGQSVAELIRQAIRGLWLKPEQHGLVGLWDSPPPRTSVAHDCICDEA